MIVRFATISAPLFVPCEGLSFGSSWGGIDVAKLDEKQVDVIVKYTGRIIRVHPADAEALRAHGLEVVDAEIRRLPKSAPPAPADMVDDDQPGDTTTEAEPTRPPAATRRKR